MSDELYSDLFDLGKEDFNATERTKIVKAPFGWVGGKTNSLKHLIPGLNKRLKDKWIDVFAGSGVVSFNVKSVKIMVLNDAYSGITDFYRILQSNRWEELKNFINKMMPPLGREQWIRARAEWCTETDELIRAAKWYYMIKCSVIQKGASFARGTNSKPPINIPGGIKCFEEVHWILRRFQLENLDFRTCLKDYASPNAVFYCDPPYVGTDSGIYKNKFNQSDLKDLLELIHSLPGTFVLSGYENEFIDKYEWDKKITWEVPIQAEVRAFSKENNKMDKENVQETDYATEVIWVKE